MAKILIADDAAFMRMKSASLVKELGHDVVEAEDGAEAVKVYQAESPDAVLMDITMPNMDGMEALQEILKLDPDAKNRDGDGDGSAGGHHGSDQGRREGLRCEAVRRRSHSVRSVEARGLASDRRGCEEDYEEKSMGERRCNRRSVR